jgi:hypothetical protein
VARLIPVSSEHPLFGAMAGSVVSETDILAPIDIDWAAQS